MTYLEILKAKTKGGDEKELISLLTEQGIESNAEFKTGQRGFDLAYAWYLVVLITSPNWSQGDMSESWDRDALANIASNIFSKYGEDNPLKETSTLENCSDLW